MTTRTAATSARSPRDACIAAAKRRLLAGDGPTLRAADVLAEARVERAVFYRHFENVAALLAAVDAQRAADDERDGVLVALVHATAAGLLGLGEFERRVDAVFAADRWGELRALLADLPPAAPSISARAPRSSR